jgi:hypothetical protein
MPFLALSLDQLRVSVRPRPSSASRCEPPPRAPRGKHHRELARTCRSELSARNGRVRAHRSSVGARLPRPLARASAPAAGASGHEPPARARRGRHAPRQRPTTESPCTRAECRHALRSMRRPSPAGTTPPRRAPCPPIETSPRRNPRSARRSAAEPRRTEPPWNQNRWVARDRTASRSKLRGRPRAPAFFADRGVRPDFCIDQYIKRLPVTIKAPYL